MKTTKKLSRILALGTLALLAGLGGRAYAEPIDSSGPPVCDGNKYHVNGLITISCLDANACWVTNGKLMVINNQPFCCHSDALGQLDCEQLNQLIDYVVRSPSTRLGYASPLLAR